MERPKSQQIFNLKLKAKSKVKKKTEHFCKYFVN